MSRKALNYSALVLNVHRGPSAGFSGPTLCGESASPLCIDLQIPRCSLIITGLLVAAARFGSSSTYSEFIFSSIVFGSFIQRSGMEKPSKIAPAKGKLGVLLPGLGAVSTTFMAGVELVRKGKAQPVGSLTQLGTIRLGKRTEGLSPQIKKFVPLGDLKDLVFGSWDIFKDNAYQAASKAGVLSPQDLDKVKPFLSKIAPMKAAFDREYVKKLDGTHVKRGKSKYDLALQIKEDIENFRKARRVSRMVTCWCGSTEIFITPEEVHSTPEKFVEAMKANHPAIAPSMLYAWASVTSGVPFANGAPNLTVDIPAIQKLAHDHNVAICGKDFKTGQTLMKTILAPGFKARMLGLEGWFSTNILGNRDGEVLEDPGSFKTKEESKLSVLEYI